MVLYKQVLFVGLFLIAVSICGLKSVTSATNASTNFTTDSIPFSSDGFPTDFKIKTKLLISRINSLTTFLKPTFARLKRFLPSATNSNVGLQLDEFEKEIKEVKENIAKMTEQIKQLESSTVTSTEDRINFQDLKNSLKILYSRLDELTAKWLQMNDNVIQFMADTINMIRNYATELDSMKNIIQQKEMEKEKNRLLDEYIGNISKSFKDAQNNLKQMSAADINRLVMKVYNKQENNFDIVLNLADIASVPQNFFIYSALNLEMENIGHVNNTFRWIQLIKSLKRRITDRFHYPIEFKTRAELLANDLINKIKMAMKEILKDAILSGQYGLSDELAFEIVSLLQYGMIKEIIADAIHDVFNRTGVEKLISFINSFTHNELIISGYATVYGEMQQNDSALFQIAAQLKNLTWHNPEPNSALVSDYETLKNKIPKFVMAMVSSSDVYIKNVRRDMYLFRHADIFGSNIHRFGTDILQNIASTGKWIFEHEKDNIFAIKNAKYSGYVNVVSEKPREKSHKTGHLMDNYKRVENSGKWKVTFEGNNIQLKNVLVNEYLSDDYDASPSIFPSYICTVTPDTATRNTLWKIEI